MRSTPNTFTGRTSFGIAKQIFGKLSARFSTANTTEQSTYSRANYPRADFDNVQRVVITSAALRIRMDEGWILPGLGQCRNRPTVRFCQGNTKRANRNASTLSYLRETPIVKVYIAFLELTVVVKVSSVIESRTAQHRTLITYLAQHSLLFILLDRIPNFGSGDLEFFTAVIRKDLRWYTGKSH
jgi:hypothetical protein